MLQLIVYHTSYVIGYDVTHGGFDFGERNSGGVSILDFAIAYDLMIVSSYFKKKEDYLVTFRSDTNKTQIDYFLIRTNKRCCINIVK